MAWPVEPLTSNPAKQKECESAAKLPLKLPSTSGGCQAHSNSARLPRRSACVTFDEAKKPREKCPEGNVPHRAAAIPEPFVAVARTTRAGSLNLTGSSRRRSIARCCPPALGFLWP